jgi:hypothetical protein
VLFNQPCKSWLRPQPFIRECLEKGNERALVLHSQRHAAIRVFAEIGIECGATLDARRVMLDDLFQCLESPIVHVRSREFDIAQTGYGKLAVVPRLFCDLVTAQVFGDQIKAVVRKSLALKQGSAMAVKTIGPKLFVARIVFSVKQFETALLFRRKFGFATKDTIELRVIRRLDE